MDSWVVAGGKVKLLACLRTAESPTLRHAWFVPKGTLEVFDEYPKDLYLLLEVRWRGNPSTQQETRFSSSVNQIIIPY